VNNLAAARSPYLPPRFEPPAHDLSPWLALWRSRVNPIEAWPRSLYERDFHRSNLPLRHVFVMEPNALRAILSQPALYPRGQIFTRTVRRIWGDGLLATEGENWQRQHRLIAQALRPAQMLDFVPAIVRAAEIQLCRWRAMATVKGAVSVDIHSEMTDITLGVILETMLSGGEGLDYPALRQQISSLIDIVGRNSLPDMLGLPDWLERLMPDRARSHVLSLKTNIEKMLRERRANPVARTDLVNLLLAAQDAETGAFMDDDQVGDNLIGMIAAGHETTANVLTWSMYLIANHRPTEERMLDEIQQVAGDQTIDADHINRLVFTRQVLQEALRLYPTAPFIIRVAQEDAVLSGELIRKGTMIFIPIYVIHRHYAHWLNPNAFDPDRFASSANGSVDRYTYLPFGAGPRVCLGASFAMIEATAILATLIRRVNFTPEPDHPIRPVARVTLKPDGGLPGHVQFRP
jgi:cytochrome P450